MKHKKEAFLYAAAFLLILFMHLFLLDRLPRGLNVDELGSAYDAYSLGHFGVDRWLKSWPIYFKNYGDGQNALYTYLLVPILLLFGNSVYAIRSVIVLSALFMAVFGAGTVALLFDNKQYKISFLFLYATMPVFTIMLRFGLESHLMMGLSAICIYYLVKSAKTGKHSAFVLLGISAGLVLYTYAIAYVVIAFFLLLSLVYLIAKKRLSFSRFLCTFVPFVLLAWPLAAVQLINMFDLPELVIGPFTFTKLLGYRSQELMLTGFLTKILSGLKSTLLFDDLPYNSIPRFGNFYYISIPFILLGIGLSFYKTGKSLKRNESISLYAFPLFYWLSYTLFSGFMSATPGYINLTRMNGVLASLILFLFEGLLFALHLIKSAKIRNITGCVAGCCYFVLFLFFGRFYFTDFDSYAYPYKWLFYEPYDEELFDFLEDPKNGYTENSVFLPWNYMYYVWASKADPHALNMIQASEEDRDIHQIGRYKMLGGIQYNSEYIEYKYGYTEENRAYFEDVLHFIPMETDHFVLFLDPFHDCPLFQKNLVLGSAKEGNITLEKAYLDDAGNGQASLYGWIHLPASVNDIATVSLTMDGSVIPLPVIADTTEDDRVICFMGNVNYESFYSSSQKIFSLDLQLMENDSVMHYEIDINP